LSAESAAPPVGGEAGAIRRNVGWLAADRAFRLAVGLAVNVWMVRYLGADGLGLLGFAQSLAGLAAILGHLGLESVMVRELVRAPREEGEVLGTSAVLRAAGSLAALALTAGIMLALRPGDRTALVLAAVLSSATLFQTLEVIEGWFQSRSHFGPYVVARAVAFVGGALAKVGCLAAGLGIEALAAAITFEFALSAVTLAVAYATHGGRFAVWRVRLAHARSLLASSWPLMLSTVAIVVYARTDQLMITLMRGDHENGIYAAAQRLSEILYFVPVALSSAAAPAIHRAWAEGPEPFRRRLARLFGVLGQLGLAAAVVVSFAAGWGVRLLFGEAFADSAPVLALHVWAAPAVFLGVAQSNWFVARGEERGLLVRTAVGAALNVALNLWLIPRWGAIGAAAATLVSQALSMIAFNALTPATRELFRMQCRALVPVPPR